MRVYLTICIILLWSLPNINAQYFGQNKPSYEKFNFRLYKTPNFELYHYFEDKEHIKELGKLAEKWYYYHQQVLLDTFYTRNPVILYSNHADFQQTTAVSSRIEVGTGGVTEGMKRRVVMPVTFTNGQTDHVLGHELVHAFQYHMLTTDKEINLMAINNIPLWMIEGMAEFLSLGSINSQTALWMRDALINNNFPTLRDMTRSYRYSPYKYGHAFWAFISYKYGEQYIPRLFKATARHGYEKAISDVLMLSDDSLSIIWKEALENHLLSSINDSTFSIVGNKLISKKNSGHYNLNPSISPDGKYLVYLSEKDLYDIDLFVADANTGKVISRFYSATSYDEIDALNYLETAGSWSPDSRFFAFMAFMQGESLCIIFDMNEKRIANQIHIPEYDEISWPAWSPDGNDIAFSALKEGISDIIIYNLKTKESSNITKNRYSCIQPAWTKNGLYIYYVTDQDKNRMPVSNRTLNIARTTINGSEQKTYHTFNGANNLNPIPTDNNNEVIFLSNRDGCRNLYLLKTEDENIYQITHYPTGITGITEYSPALTMTGDTLCYTMLSNGEFSVYKTLLPYIRKNITEVNERSFEITASRLLPYSHIPSQIETNLYFNRQPYSIKTDSFYTDRIRNKFKLDYIGNTSAGVMTGRFGAGMAGSVEAMFSDIFGTNMLYTALSINGEIYDFGGQIAYINKKKRINLGFSLSHIPYRTGYYTYQTDSLADGSTSRSLNYIFRRTFEDKLSVFTYIPINKTRRFELGASYAFYNYRIERMKNASPYSSIYSKDKEKLPAPDGFSTGILDAAFVIDNAKMGIASPVEGKRLRIQVEQYMHKLRMYTLLIDFRRYIFVKPNSLAFRIYHYGRYGQDSDNQHMSRIFIGSPWFVRGYHTGDFFTRESQDKKTISLNQLIGSRIIISNIEWRVPFTGPKKIAVIPSNFLMSEMAFFIDGGLSWNKSSKPVASLTTSSDDYRIPIFSSGVAYRINLFGALVFEPFYSFPFYQQQFHKGQFGVNIFAGW